MLEKMKGRGKKKEEKKKKKKTSIFREKSRYRRDKILIFDINKVACRPNKAVI